MLEPITVILSSLVFLIGLGISCPCPNPIPSKSASFLCFRDETDAAISHVVFFALLGYCFPNDGIFWQCLGILWEIAEVIVDQNHNLLEYTGGCTHEDIALENKGNYLDNVIRIMPTQLHVWHSSFSDIVCNILGFMIGSQLRKVVLD